MGGDPNDINTGNRGRLPMISILTASIIGLVATGLCYFVAYQMGYREGVLDGIVAYHTGQVSVKELDDE
jgi:hypothetical protein